MYIYGHFGREKSDNAPRLDIQISSDITPEILQRAAEDPDFQIISTRSRCYYVPDELQPKWIEIEPNLDI